MNPRCVVIFCGAMALMYCGSVPYSHPSLPGNEHPHSAATVKWEADPVRDGNSAHNHYDPFPYHGAETLIQPATFGRCWDNLTLREDGTDATFDKGHCFINEIMLNGTPAYYFSGPWNSSAKQRVRDAFETYNSIFLVLAGYQLGMSFAETTSSTSAQIIVTYDSCAVDCVNGGIAIANPTLTKVNLKFDSDYNWSFQQSKSGMPPDKWHFFSVALHEIGHVAGLGHQPAGDLDDLMASPEANHVGAPLNQGGRHFDQIDTDSAIGLARLYTQSESPPPTVWCYDPPLFLGCPYGCMSSPYLMQWGGQNASSFVVQKSGFSGWSNWYSGTNTSSFASTGTIYHEYFRVKAVSASGVSSNWCNMTLYVQCSEEMDPW